MLPGDGVGKVERLSNEVVDATVKDAVIPETVPSLVKLKDNALGVELLRDGVGDVTVVSITKEEAPSVETKSIDGEL